MKVELRENASFVTILKDSGSLVRVTEKYEVAPNFPINTVSVKNVIIIVIILFNSYINEHLICECYIVLFSVF